MASAFAALLLCLPAGWAHAAAGTQSQAQLPAQQHEALLLQFQSAPLTFERNAGQTDGRVAFLARGTNYQLFRTGPHATIKLTRHGALRQGAAPLATSAAVRVRWLGAQDGKAALGEGPLPARVNYFRGGAKPASVVDVATYERVRYTGLYPGVDLVYYAKQGELEYDFVVAPGADPGRIRFALEGARQAALDEGGNLVMQTAAGDAKLHRPVVYQLAQGARQPVDARYERDGAGAWRIALGPYDRNAELVIDPVLSYGTYLGGTSTNRAVAIAVDAAGSAYVAGYTASADFPVVSAYRSTLTAQGDTDAFVTKFNPGGSALVYSTYLGGVPPRRTTVSQSIKGIAVDAAGNAYVTGTTTALSFPTTAGAYQTTTTNGGSFVTKLAPNGASLVYSTYVRDVTAAALAIDAAGNAYITGTATAAFVATPGAFQTTYRSTSGAANGFAASLNAGGTAMRYASFLGGSDNDIARSIAVDASGSAYVAGSTTSTDFPVTAGAYQTAPAGGADGFLAKFNPAGSGLVFSTRFGGQLDDHINGVAVGAGGAAYIVGETYSANLPLRNAFQPQKAGRNLVNSSLGNVFVAKLFPGGDALAYGSFLGGEVCRLCESSFGVPQIPGDFGQGIAVDAAGRAYITGIAQSYLFPLVNSLIPNQGSSTVLQNSGFAAKIGIAGTAVLYNTLTTTDADKNMFSVAVDAAGNAYGAGTAASPGQTGSIDLVAPGSYMPTPNASAFGGYGLVYKLASATPALTLTTSANPGAAWAPMTLSASIADSGLTGSVTFYDGGSALGSAPLSGGSATLAVSLSAGVHRLTAVYRSASTAADSPLLYAVVNPSSVCK